MSDRPETYDLICSARGCKDAASWAVRWNNPKLHPPERRKTWLACERHRTYLADFLAARGFLREIEPFDPSGGTDADESDNEAERRSG